jgi:hypothetical protein
MPQGKVFGNFAAKMVEDYSSKGKNVKPLLANIRKQTKTSFSQ